MSSAQKSDQLPAKFTRAPHRSELQHLSLRDQIRYLILADGNAYGPEVKLWFLADLLTDEQKAAFVASNTR